MATCAPTPASTRSATNDATRSLRPRAARASSARVDAPRHSAQVAFTGSTRVGQLLRRETAGSGIKLSLELGGKSPTIVFDSADLDSAVEAIVSSIWFNQGQVCCAGSRLLVQENVSESLVAKLKWRLGKMRVGASLDKCMDSGAMVDRLQCDLDLDLARPSAHSVT